MISGSCDISKRYFFACISILLGLYCYLMPTAALSPELYAEAGTDFYFHARYSDLIGNLWAPHGGYLPWFQRVLAVIVVKLFGFHEYYTNFIQILSLLFAAVFCSLLCLSPFERLIPSPLMRFALALNVGLFPQYNMYTFINFSYFGSVFALYMLFRESSARSRISELLLFISLAIIVCSKTFFVVFVPLFLLRAAVSARNGRWLYAGLWCLPVATELFQLGFMYTNRGLYTSTDATRMTFVQRVNETLYFYFYSVGNVLIQNRSIVDSPTAKMLVNLSIGGLLGMFAAFVIFLRRRKVVSALWIAALNILAAGSLWLATIMMPIQEVKWAEPAFLDQSRWFLFGYVFLLLALLGSLSALISSRLFHLVASGYLALAAYGNTTRIVDYFDSDQTSFSQWGSYSHLLARDTYCIPINPYPWMLHRNCYFMDDGIDLATKIDTNGSVEATVLGAAQHRKLIGALIILPENSTFRGAVKVQAYGGEAGTNLTGTLLSRPYSRYQYFIFDAPISGWERVVVSNSATGNGLPVSAGLRLLGSYPN